MIIIKTKEKFALYPNMPWERRFKFCRSAASWLSNRYNLNYEDTLNDCVAAVLDEEELINATPALIDPAAPTNTYWKAIKCAVERKRRPPRKYFKKFRAPIALTELTETAAEDNTIALLELKDIVNSVLRRIEPTQYKILSRLLTAAMSGEGVKARPGRLIVSGNVAEAIANEFKIPAATVRSILKAFLLDCREQNGL